MENDVGQIPVHHFTASGNNDADYMDCAQIRYGSTETKG